MAGLTSPAGAPADQTRRCPGCTTRVPLTDHWCDVCWTRLPYELAQPVQAAWRRDERAYLAAVHNAREWLKNNPPTPTPAELQDALDIIAGTGRHAGHKRTQGGDWVGCSCGAVTRGRLE